MTGSTVLAAFGAIFMVVGVALGGMLWVPGAVVLGVGTAVAMREFRQEAAQRRHVESKRERPLRIKSIRS